MAKNCCSTFQHAWNNPLQQGIVRSKLSILLRLGNTALDYRNFHIRYFNLSFRATIWGRHYASLVQMKKLRLGEVKWCAQVTSPRSVNHSCNLYWSSASKTHLPSHTDSRRKKEKKTKGSAQPLSLHTAVQWPLQPGVWENQIQRPRHEQTPR